MHSDTSYTLKVILGKALLIIAGHFIVFNIYFFGREGFRFQDVMGIRGLWLRPYYHAVLNLVPYFYSHPYIRLLHSPKYWLKLILDLFIPALAITAFEESSVRRRPTYVILFYLFVPTTLYLIASVVVMHYFPSDS